MADFVRFEDRCIQWVQAIFTPRHCGLPVRRNAKISMLAIPQGTPADQTAYIDDLQVPVYLPWALFRI